MTMEALHLSSTAELVYRESEIQDVPGLCDEHVRADEAHVSAETGKRRARMIVSAENCRTFDWGIGETK